MSANNKRAGFYMLHRAFNMSPRLDFVSHALAALDKFEADCKEQEIVEIAKAKKRREENPDPTGEEFDLADEMAVLRGQHRVDFPLNARYSALVLTVAGMEWLIRLLHQACYREAVSILELQAKTAGAETARAFHFAGLAAQRAGRGQKRVPDILELLAETGGVQQKKSSKAACKDFRALCVVRHAIVHCGGRVEDVNPNALPEFRKAAQRLGFRLLKKVEIDGESHRMPMSALQLWARESEQLWIGPDALKPIVEKVLAFIKDLHEVHLGS